MIVKVKLHTEVRHHEFALSVTIPAKEEIHIKEGVGGIKVFIGDKLVYEEGEHYGKG